MKGKGKFYVRESIFNLSDKNNPNKTRQYSVNSIHPGYLVLTSLSLSMLSDLTYAACSSTAPTSNVTVNCTGTSSTAIVGQAGASNVIVNIEAGATLQGNATRMIQSPADGTGGWAVDNAGTVATNGASSYGVFLQQTGQVNNLATGSISATYRGVSIAGNGATLENYGSIKTTGSGSDYGVSMASGSDIIFNNYLGATVEGSRAVNLLTSTITNAGTITGISDYGLRVGSGATGTVTNYSTGKIKGTMGVSLSGAGSSLTNFGEITTIASSYSVDLPAGGTIVNNLGGLISGVSNSRGVSITGGAGSLTNAGTINVTNTGTAANTYYAAYLSAGGTINNSGTINGGNYLNHYGVRLFGGAGTLTNEAGGVITVGANGLYSVSMSGGTQALYNSGTLIGNVSLDPTNASTFANYSGGILTGSLTMGSGANTAIIDSNSSISGSLSGGSGGNNTLQLQSAGATNKTYAAGTYTNFQTLQSNIAGSGVWTLTGTQTYTGGVNAMAGTLINNGILNGSGGTTISGATAVLDNQGSITTSANNGVMISAAGTLINESSGTITGAQNGVFVQSSGTTINNAGSITGTAHDGIYLSNGGTLTNALGGSIQGAEKSIEMNGTSGEIVNSGTLLGDILFGTSGIATLTNHGTITGNVMLGAGDDVLSIDTSTGISGDVDGGLGSNTLNLMGAADDTYDGSYLNFQKLGVDISGNKTWTLTGTQTYDNGVEVINGNLLNNADLTGNIIYTTIDAAILTNHGTIIGNVTLGEGDDILSIDTSTGISGDVDGGLGNNTLNLMGAADDTYDGSYLNFQKLGVDVSGNKTWTLTGTQTYTDGIEIKAGNLTLDGTLNSSITFDHGGVFINQANRTLTGGSRGVLIKAASGNLDNAGTITTTATASSYAAELTAGGTVTNHANSTLSGNYRGISISTASGEIDNAGLINASINNANGYGAYLAAGGDLINQATGNIAAYKGVFDNSGTITNAGTITGTGDYGVYFAVGGELENQATGVIEGFNRGLLVHGDTATITNAGSITSSNSGTYGIELTAGGTVTNESGATIQGVSHGLSISGNVGSVSNAGTITGTDHYGVLLVSSGEIENLADGIIEGGQWGVMIGGVEGMLINQGQIKGDVAFDTTEASSLINYGVIDGNVTLGAGDDLVIMGADSNVTGTLDGGLGNNTLKLIGAAFSTYDGRYSNFQTLDVDLPDEAVWTLAGTQNYDNGINVSQGQVAVEGNINGGITFNHGGEVTTAVNSSISSEGNGIYVLSGMGTITNSGLVNSTNADAIYLSSGGTIQNHTGAQIIGDQRGVQINGSTGTLTNAGSIIGTTEYGVRFSAGGEVNNQEGGIITGNTRGISISGATGTINNQGTITANDPNGYGILLNNGGEVVNDVDASITGGQWSVMISGATGSLSNAGVITGDILFNTSDAATFHNAGTINGDITLESGNNVIEISTGSQITGTLDAGLGTNTLKLIGETSDTYGGEFIGFNKLIVSLAEEGAWALTGTQTYSDGIDVNTGALSINGIVNSGVNVYAGGILKGNGNLTQLIVHANGILAPGNSIGTLTTDSAHFDSNSVFEVEIDAEGSSDLLEVTGATTITGGTLSIIKEPGVYQFGKQYTILTAVDGITGEFDHIVQNMPLINMAVAYDLNRIYLTVLSTDNVNFAGFGVTPNQVATGLALQSVPYTNPLYSAFASLSEGQATALKQISGEIHASLKPALLSEINHAKKTARLHKQTSPEKGKLAWFKDLSVDKHKWADSFDNEPLYQNSLHMLLGANTQLSQRWTLSLLSGLSEAETHFSQPTSMGTISTWHALAMLTGVYKNIELLFGNSTGFHSIDTQRDIHFSGFSEKVKANYKSVGSEWFTEANVRVSDDLGINIFLNMNYTTFDTKAFQEKGGEAALSSAKQHDSIVFGTIGIQSKNELLSQEGVLTSNILLGWQQVLDGKHSQANLSLEGGDKMRIHGAPFVDDTMIAEFNLSTHLLDPLMGQISYSFCYDGKHITEGVAKVTLAFEL